MTLYTKPGTVIGSTKDTPLPFATGEGPGVRAPFASLLPLPEAWSKRAPAGEGCLVAKVFFDSQQLIVFLVAVHA